MNPVQRAWLFIFVLIFLAGCTQMAGDKNAPSLSITNSPIQASSPSDTLLPSPTTPPTTTLETETATPSATLQPTPTQFMSTANITPGECQLSTVTQPPRPAATYQPNALDAETGLHVTGLVQYIELSSYRLLVTGLVEHPLSLTYDELRCMPKVTANPELVCPGVFTDYATWSGVQIKTILAQAGIQKEAGEVTLVSVDGYQVKIPLQTALLDTNILAYEVNGETLPVIHGFPLRAVFPDMWGSYWLKWLVEIRIS